MKPIQHAEISVKHFGGVVEDYLEIHNYMEIGKMSVSDFRHRALFHHSLGPFILEKIFGHYIVNYDSNKVAVRSIVEQHIIDDLGRVPQFSEYVEHITLAQWMHPEDGPFPLAPVYKKGESIYANPQGAGIVTSSLNQPDVGDKIPDDFSFPSSIGFNQNIRFS